MAGFFYRWRMARVGRLYQKGNKKQRGLTGPPFLGWETEQDFSRRCKVRRKAIKLATKAGRIEKRARRGKVPYDRKR